MRFVWGLFALLVVCATAKVAVPDARAAESPVTVSFTEVGAHSFIVPAGVTSIHVVAVGAPGGNGEEPGGLGAMATADIAVTPGQSLAVFVGGPGTSEGAATGGFNGGGNGVKTFTGGGGGASDVRTNAADLTSRLIVAGGGGGGGWSRSSIPAPVGGNAGESGGSTEGCTGGQAASQAKGGSGGTGTTSGAAGSLGQGGGTGAVGAGGGGGLFGGGAGGRYLNSGLEQLNDCGGGGGSSGFGPGTGSTSVTISKSPPSVTITYTPVANAPGTKTEPTPPAPGGPGGGQTATKATLSLLAVQHGKAVVSTVKIPANRSSLVAKLFLRAGGGNSRLLAATRQAVGSLTEAPLKKGLHSFTVKLNRKGKQSLMKRGKLKLTLQVRVTPPQGTALAGVKQVTLKP